MPSASQYVRPGPSTANAVAFRKAMSGSYPPVGLIYWWIQRVRYSDFSETDTSQSLNLNTAFPQNAFPTDAFLTFGPTAYLDLIEVFAGGSVSAATLILGVSGNTNGLVESVNVFTGQTLERKYAAGDLYVAATLDQAAMAPLLELNTTTDNIDTLTSGIVDVYIPYTLAPTRRPINGF